MTAAPHNSTLSAQHRQVLANLDRRFRSALLAYFGRRVSSAAEAEDLTQDVFERLLRAPAVYTPETLDPKQPPTVNPLTDIFPAWWLVVSLGLVIAAVIMITKTGARKPASA